MARTDLHRKADMPQQVQQFLSVRHLLDNYKNGARPWTALSPHAVRRYMEMKLAADEFSAALIEPTDIGYSHKYDAMLLKNGRVSLSVMLDRDGYPTVATVLFATREDWQEAYESGNFGDGRSKRADLGHLPSKARV